MYYSYVEIEYVATSFSPARTDLALKLIKDMTLVGEIRLNCKGFKADSLMPVVFAKKVLQKYLVHNRG